MEGIPGSLSDLGHCLVPPHLQTCSQHRGQEGASKCHTSQTLEMELYWRYSQAEQKPPKVTACLPGQSHKLQSSSTEATRVLFLRLGPQEGSTEQSHSNTGVQPAHPTQLPTQLLCRAETQAEPLAGSFGSVCGSVCPQAEGVCSVYTCMSMSTGP
jgi:hypothetical protein